MPKSYFSVSNARSLSELAAGAHVHVIGVCGVAMAQLAIVLSEMGYKVSGSDKEFYEPMGGLLKGSSVVLHQGFSASNISPDAALVVIGNAVSYENVEVLETERIGVPYTLFPKLLYETVIAGGHSVVVSGTHGKSTTSAWAATVLEKVGLDPGYFVGGVARDLPFSLKRGGGKISVVEGDEYDSAFFAKVPKFTFYRPDTLIVTSIEFDHADIYPDLESIVSQFSALIGGMPNNSTVIACIDCPTVRREISCWRQNSPARVITYGEAPDAEVRITQAVESGEKQTVQIQAAWGKRSFDTKLSGLYNARNAVAVLLAVTAQGVSWERAAVALAQFSGVRRRQEVRIESGGVVLIEDFAHHPTAVRETLRGIRARWPERRILAVFEPRSNTSRRKVFQRDYVEAFGAADAVILCEVTARSIDTSVELLSVPELAADITLSGTRAESLPNSAAIAARLDSEIKAGDVIVVMSNGSFGGLPLTLEESIRARSAAGATEKP